MSIDSSIMSSSKRGPGRSAAIWRQLAALALLGLGACPEAGSDCKDAGVEGCPCTPQGECLAGLQCLSNFCVAVSTSAPPASGEQGEQDEQGDTDDGESVDPDSGEEPTTGPAPGCGEGLTRCGEVCVDIDGHPQHCGGCGEQCAAGGVCIAGECAAPVDCSKDACPGFTYCDIASETCLPGCDHNPQCPQGSYCDLETHACGCKPGFHECGGVCVLDSDPNACGAGCVQCKFPANGDAACIEGECTILCNENENYHECGGVCYSEAQVICENNRDTCKVCPDDMPGEPMPGCDQDGNCTYVCPNDWESPCDGICKDGPYTSCDSNAECCESAGYTCQPDWNGFRHCEK